MESRCNRLSHDVDACKGDEGKMSRCRWSHGAEEEFDKMGVDEDHLQCIWDQTGCAKGECNVDAMESRCSRMNRDMDACKGDEGKMSRCVWGKATVKEVAVEEVPEVPAVPE